MPCQLFAAFVILIIPHSQIILQSLRGPEGLFTYSGQQAWSRSWLWTVGAWGGWWSTPGRNSHTV